MSRSAAGSKRANRCGSVPITVPVRVATPSTTGTGWPRLVLPYWTNCTVPWSVGSARRAVIVTGWFSIRAVGATVMKTFGCLISGASAGGEPAGAIVTGISSVPAWVEVTE